MAYQDYIKKYRILLLEIIPDFFNEDDILNFNFESPDERKRYFADLKFSTDPEYCTKEYIHHYYSDKKKSELREPYIKQQKRWIEKCSAFVKKMQDVLPYIDHPDLPQFRFKFFNKYDKHLENDLKDKTEVSIFVCFMSYLYKLRNEQESLSTAKTIINDKMIVQGEEYIQKNEDRIEKALSAKTGRSKNKKRVSVDFNDVKLEMTVDSKDSPLFDAIVSANEVDREKLKLEDRFLEPLYFLAKTVKEGKNNGWVYNKDLKNKYSKEGTNKIKYEIIKAFKKVIGTGAMDIITIKHGSAKKLMIPKKNIKFKSI